VTNCPSAPLRGSFFFRLDHLRCKHRCTGKFEHTHKGKKILLLERRDNSVYKLLP
jgi:hypothetical protein